MYACEEEPTGDSWNLLDAPLEVCFRSHIVSALAVLPRSAKES